MSMFDKDIENKQAALLLNSQRQKTPDEAHDDDIATMHRLDPSTRDSDVMQAKLLKARARAEQLGYSQQRIGNMKPEGITRMLKDAERDQQLHDIDASLARAKIKAGRVHGSMENLNKNEVAAQFLFDIDKQEK